MAEVKTFVSWLPKVISLFRLKMMIYMVYRRLGVFPPYLLIDILADFALLNLIAKVIVQAASYLVIIGFSSWGYYAVFCGNFLIGGGVYILFVKGRVVWVNYLLLKFLVILGGFMLGVIALGIIQLLGYFG